MTYLMGQLTRVDQTTLPMILQGIRSLGLSHSTLLAEHVEEIGKLSSSGSSTVRLLVQQIKEDVHK